MNWASKKETLSKQCSFNLKERAADFNRHFKTDKMSVRLLRKIYYKKKVNKKFLKISKLLTPEQAVK